jgi:signal transduction histidine kinase
MLSAYNMEVAASVNPPTEVPGHRVPVFLLASWLAALALSATAALIVISGPAPNPGLVAPARALIVGVPIAVGLYAWSKQASRRFGLLLVATGSVWFLTTFAESGDDVLYTIGRTAGWLAEVLLVYVFLAFPDGRLNARLDRVLVALTGAVLLVAFVPRLALAEHFLIPSPYTSCVHDCPPNALFALDHQPAFVDGVLKPAGALMSVALMVLVLLRLRDRMRAASPLARGLLAPVVAVGAARVALLAAGFILREADSSALSVRIVSWSLALAVPAIAIAFLLAIFRRRLFAGGALERLGERLGPASDARAIRRAFADAFGDPNLEIAFPGAGGDGWVGSTGAPLTLPPADEAQTVTEIRDRGDLVAVVVHDRALASDPRLLQAATGIAAVVLDNRRLVGEASTAAQEIWRSRAMVADAERERRRIERDLHDGAQQRLVALRIELELAEELVRRDPERGADRLHELEQGVDEALEEVRSLAHGVYPPTLADQGLGEALRAASRQSPISVDVDAEGVGRYAPEVESAVYFCVLEALQNVLKHAEGARRVTVRMYGAGTDLRFSVRDDGAAAGDGEFVAGAGMTNMRDRIASVGGELEVSAVPQVGTTVRGHVPSPVRQG